MRAVQPAAQPSRVAHTACFAPLDHRHPVVHARLLGNRPPPGHHKAEPSIRLRQENVGTALDRAKTVCTTRGVRLTELRHRA